jgi:hypothetical protein
MVEMGTKGDLSACSIDGDYDHIVGAGEYSSGNFEAKVSSHGRGCAPQKRPVFWAFRGRDLPLVGAKAERFKCFQGLGPRY